MYNVSQDYINALEQPVQDYKLNITIDGVTYDESVIVGGSFSITNQCSEGDTVQIGSVYCAELKLTIVSGTIQRGTWDGAIISCSEGMDIGIDEETHEHIYEYVPLGVFTVSEANHTEDGVQIVAYDNMLKFDKTLGMTTTVGTAYSILSLICNDCGVTLGMTQADVQALPNGTQSIALYSENDCETYRDVLFWLAQTVCTFATIGRDGKLYLRKYQATEDCVLTASDQERFEGGSFSDFVTEYSGVAYTDIDTQEYVYYSEGVDDKLTYNLGANPFLQYGSGSVKKQMCLNILRELKKIAYTPFKTQYLNTPAYDLGDVIRNTSGIAGDSYCCIMMYEYSFSGGYSVEGFGQNPALATARNKTDKELAGIMSRTDKNSVQFYTFKNSEQAVIDDGESAELINLRFTTLEAKQVTFQAEILCESEADVDEVIASIDYYLDNVQITDYQPTETWTEDGKHIISLYYMVTVEPNTLYQWRVRLNSDGGKITVPIEHARGTIWGTGLVALHSWDGFIDAEDTFRPIGMNDSIGIMQFWDMVTVDVGEPLLIEAEDSMEAIDITDSIDLKPFQAEYYIDKTSLYYDGITWGDIKEDLWATVLDEHVW